MAPGDVIEIVVADSGKGGTLHRNDAPPNTGAGGSGAGSGGATANSSNPNDEGAYSLNGGGGGGASSLTVAGTFIRAGGGGGGGGAHRNQSTFSHAESGSAALIPAVPTPDCASPADGLGGTSSPYVVENQGYQGTGSGGGGGGGYLGAVGAGGVTPGLIFGTGFPTVEFAPTGGGGGSCTLATGARALSAVTSDSQGGAGGAADPNPISTWVAVSGAEPAPIDGSPGWVKLTVPDLPVVVPSAATPVPALTASGLGCLTMLTAFGGAFFMRRRKQTLRLTC